MSKTPALREKIAKYPVDQKAWQGKSVRFTGLPSGSHCAYSGTGSLDVRQYKGIGLVYIMTNTEWSDSSRTHLHSYRFTLPESLARQLKPDGASGYILKG